MEAFLISITSIALGELGDKTQILALILATRLQRPVAVILGILVATLASHVIAALLGQWAGSVLNPQILRWILGISFLVLAAWALIPEKGEVEPHARDGYGAFVLTVTAFFIAEMGDKTQIVAMALAAKYHNLIAVVAGSTIGMMVINVPTVLLARHVTRIVPLKWIRVAAALVYALLGVLTLLGYAGLGLG
jgi:putative Ca2+/H+ antiporter (TMEM165/GDT1 family)